jgi:hypothetical protein
MSEQERLLAEILKPLMLELGRRTADNELDYARARFKKVVERILGLPRPLLN